MADNQASQAFKQARSILSTPEGQMLMDELSAIWNPPNVFSTDPNQLAYNVGLRDAYIFLEELQSGALINE